ncbi:MAG: 50S ribosomal protein L19 [Chlamydiae bacterium GWC2_50_10]|nr:MAG: 50S ribosomal protein L19 [Chlamydiae bacterium GWA2_50_15]OGN54973.1 MAG: 50S ribosomal protein L19 [Chlamydiae bacterium GWC2_50_10]OGN55839.1 MAG: 50S ribosomal protein L19 [Chlamydiae bacterium GWF2_49_8]OGN58700.1 MAG: 50S ribosomal protein L19 [Chlamydiae bacterium RIFCSPHIGHO2_02_FULL_49_29]OGN63093.1 MAG: 50S ribosomal protein L19 [Chlamydiae bacterium RIFCSPHIGHO2_12_FULL_49_32]OGN68750.1 MAG: 50S ribosomal protein L19 [Chlamydiae bacterium RIFCSPLOWO2_02_FULL_49_12]OGN72126.
MPKTKLIEAIESSQLKKEIPDFRVGDTLNIYFRIVEEEGSKERTQLFTGTVIARKGHGLSETATLYRVSYGSSMERIIPLHSPKISRIEVARRGKARRGKLYYLRGKKGKKSRVQEELFGVDERALPLEERASPAAESFQE